MGPGPFSPADGQSFFDAISDSAPDTWGRRLMQRAERENRPPRTLAEADYLLGVADVSRLGALRLREVGQDAFQAPQGAGVPGLVDLGRLLGVTDRILCNHGFLRRGAGGWGLSPAYDLNPTPTNLKPCFLTTNIDVDDGTCDLDLVLGAAKFFALSPAAFRTLVGEVGRAVAEWRAAAEARGVRPAKIRRMASAFEHEELQRALRL